MGTCFGSSIDIPTSSALTATPTDLTKKHSCTHVRKINACLQIEQHPRKLRPISSTLQCVLAPQDQCL